MTFKRRLLTLATLVGLVFSMAFYPVSADEVEPTVIDLAWYWEDANRQEVTTPAGTFTVETPNPYCPQPPSSVGGGDVACAQDRLPVWVQRADYMTPYQFAALSFDLSLVPIGSKVTKFEVTFLEDEAGCRDHDEDPATPDQCRNTEPIQPAGKELQACFLEQVIGAGEARAYNEAVDHTCRDSSPIAKREEIDNDAEADPNDQNPDHTWTFDLTEYAQEWVESFSASTGVVLRPVEPKAADAVDEWRVILAGPRAQDGVVTSLLYTPPKDAPFDPTDPTDTTTDPGTDFSSDTGTDFGSAPTTGFGTDSSSTDTGTGDTVGEAPATDPTDTGTDETLAGEPTSADGGPSMPGYVWLAILAGIIGFSMVRSVVIESVTGIRPNGALAQIRRLNAARRGGGIAEAAAGPSALAGFAAGIGGVVAAPFKAIGSKIGGLRRGGKS